MNEPQPIMQSRKSALVKRKPFFLADAIEAGPKALVACYNLAARGFGALIGNNALKKNALTHPRQSIAALAFTTALAAGGAGGYMKLSPALFNVTAPAAPAGTIDIIQSGILERPELRINMRPLGGFNGNQIGFGKSITFQGGRYTRLHHRDGVVTFNNGWNSRPAPYQMPENIDELSASYTQATRAAAGLGAAGAGILLLLSFQGTARYRISARRRELDALEVPRQTAALPPADPPKHNPLSLT